MMEDWCGVLGRLCGSSGESIICYLCLEDVPNSSWSSGEHRKQCASRNTSQLSSYSLHPTVTCAKCKSKLRLWPQQGPSFTCDSGIENCPVKGKLIPSTGNNRYNCFPCDFDLCDFCISHWSEHPTSSKPDGEKMTTATEQNGPHQTKQNGCHLPPTITLGEATKDDGKGNKRSSLLADEDDLIPLIDIQSSSEDIPELVTFPVKRQNSACQRQRPTLMDARSRSIASLGVTLPDPSNTLVNLASGRKKVGDSPDIFNLRAPLVSCENFLTPSTSKEGLNQIVPD